MPTLMEDGSRHSNPCHSPSLNPRDADRLLVVNDEVNAKHPQDLAAIKKQKEVRFKASHGLLIADFVLIVVLHGLGIYLFTSGFLLTRLVLDHKSQCSEPPVELHGSHVPGSAADGCWHPRTFQKAVIIIIDALRYDFTVPFQSTARNAQPCHFHNSIPVLYETALNLPRNAFLLPFIADPPTTTLQRLKGLTTGTLPTFIDAGSNFAGTAIDEDNLISQFRAVGRNVVHLGDDTWRSLFPDYFDMNHTRFYDSFNVPDLHTVDNGVSTHLLPLLHPSNVSKWDILTAHYLGVDHVGHRHGPNHPAMTSKLLQMDNVVRQVAQLLDDETLLVVMGDHGMDEKGDHGGESDDEVQAALWMFSKRGVFGRNAETMKPPTTARERPVNQIDLVSTLALLLGIPIPFNNLGAPIEEAFSGTDGSAYMNLALVNRLVASQIQRFQNEYASVGNLNPSTMAVPALFWNTATKAWHELFSGHEPTEQQWNDVAKAFLNYQQQHLAVCKALWAKFDIVSMTQGVLVLFFVLNILVLSSGGLLRDTSELNAILFLRGVAGLLFGALCGFGLAYVLPNLSLFRTAAFSAAVVCSVALAASLWSARQQIPLTIPRTFWSWTCTTFTLLLSIGFASNSFTIWEDEILLFLLITFATLLLCACFRMISPKNRASATYNCAIFMVCVRLASLSRLCREEQMPHCKSTFYASANSSTSAPWQLAISYVIALGLPTIIKLYYQSTDSYHGSAPFWISIAFRGSLYLIAVYWTLDAADQGGWIDTTSVSLQTVREYVAQLILAVASGAGIATFAYQAPMIDVEAVETNAGGQTIAEPSPSKLQKSSDPVQLCPPSRIAGPRLLVHGTTNLYGSHYALLPFTVLLLPLLLLQKPMGQAALALTTIAILSLLELLHALRQGRVSKTGQSRMSPSTTYAVGATVLAFLGHFAFFKTGHQAALSSIQWDAAFIPLRTIRYPWSPIFMVLSTFAGQILCAAAVPALVLWRRPFLLSSKQPGSSAAQLSPQALDKAREMERRRLLADLAKAVVTHILVYATINLATTMWAAHLRRHLMLYRVFCPRWLLGVAGLLVAELVAVLVGIGGVGWTFSSVSSVFGW